MGPPAIGAVYAQRSKAAVKLRRVPVFMPGQVLVCLFLFQLVMVFILAIKKAIWAPILAAFSLAITILFWRSAAATFREPLQILSFRGATNADHRDEVRGF